MGFEKNGLALGILLLGISRLSQTGFPFSKGNVEPAYSFSKESRAYRTVLKRTGSHPLNALPRNPMKPVLTKRRVVYSSPDILDPDAHTDRDTIRDDVLECFNGARSNGLLKRRPFRDALSYAQKFAFFLIAEHGQRSGCSPNGEVASGS